MTVFSPCKINIFLNILEKRPDGFHELETVMLPLDFGDSITLHLRKTGRTLECDNPNLPVDETNLALKAAGLLARRFQVDHGVKIVLQKRTPLAAGLGGGSSNAAAVLTGLNQLWKLNASETVLGELAASMGSDINFFLQHGAAICRGRGEQIERVPCKLSATILLVNPGFGISTKWAYENWAKYSAKLTAKPANASVLLRSLAADDLEGVARELYNSLEAPSVGKFPVLQMIKETMRNNGAAGALMSGSGATLFGLFAESKQAETAAQVIVEKFGRSMWTQICRCVTL
jgi:4-diphosphocytidyl-2-C-methyl-D-erythritol kinase